MKKAKIWIRALVHILFCSTFFTCSSSRSIVAHDVERISLLKQNIPKDYKISLRYIPKEVGSMCWVELNVFHLEESLKTLAQKFGNVSTNRDNITVFIKILQDLRFGMARDLNVLMEEYDCHYQEETWHTAKYFEYVSELLNATNSEENEAECESPECPRTPPSAREAIPLFSGNTTKASGCNLAVPGCNAKSEVWTFPDVLEKKLLPLLLIPMAAVITLLIWKLKESRRKRSSERPVEHEDVFIGTHNIPPPSDERQLEERRQLNTEVSRSD